MSSIFPIVNVASPSWETRSFVAIRPFSAQRWQTVFSHEEVARKLILNINARLSAGVEGFWTVGLFVEDTGGRKVPCHAYFPNISFICPIVTKMYPRMMRIAAASMFALSKQTPMIPFLILCTGGLENGFQERMTGWWTSLRGFGSSLEILSA